MTFLLDENFPTQVADALKALHLSFEHLLDHLPRGTQDEQLFQFVRQKEFYLVTRDKRMWKNKAQRQVLLDLGLGAFIHVSTTHVTPVQLTQMLLSRLEEMREVVDNRGRPFVMRIADRGKISSF